MRKILAAIILFALFGGRACAQLTQQGQEQFLSGCTGATCVLVAPGTPVNPNLLVTSGLNTFIIGVSPTTNAARLYITNDTANACASGITVSMASTGNSNLNSFNNNVAAWQSIQVQTGATGFGASSPINLPASGTVAITSQPIIGTRLAVFVVLASGCATTNVDMQVVFGTFTPTIGAVQGVLPTGATSTGENPVLVAGVDENGKVRTAVVGHASSGFTLDGWSLGTSNQGVLTSSNGVRTPAGGSDGMLGVWPFTITPGGTQGNASYQTKPQSGSCAASSAACPAMYIADAGFILNNFAPITVNTTGTTTNLWTSPNNLGAGAGNSLIETCYFTVKAVNTAGTAPTLDVYLQDSADNVNFNDRIHFNQFTTGTSIQAAGIAGQSANYAVGNITTGTIAAGTIVSGPLGSSAQFRYVVGGTASPSYNLTIGVACK